MNKEQLNFLNALHKSGASIKLKMPLLDGGHSILNLSTVNKPGKTHKLIYEAQDSIITAEIDYTTVSIHDLLIETTEGLKPLYYRGQICLAFDGLAHYFYLDYECELPPIGSIIADIKDRDIYISSRKRIHQIFPIIDHMDPIKIDEGYLSKLTDIAEFDIHAIFVHNEKGEKLAGFMDGQTLHYYNSASNIGRTLVRIIPIKYN